MGPFLELNFFKFLAESLDLKIVATFMFVSST